MNSRYHYLYRITNTKLNRHYYGTRSSKIPPDKDLGHRYFSSSHDKEFIKDQKLNPDDYRYKVILCTSSRKRALRYECRIHKIFNVDANPTFYNRSRQTSVKFSTSGKLTVRDADGNTFSVSVDDPRYLSGELVGNTKGRVSVKDRSGNTFSVSVNDPRFLSGELVGPMKGKLAVRDADGNTFSVSVDDPRYLSGELVTFWKGRKHSKQTLKKMKIFHRKNLRVGKDNYVFGTRWICNLELKKNKMVPKDEPIPAGWIKGINKWINRVKNHHVCQCCGIEFYSNSRKQKYCSIRCAAIVNNKTRIVSDSTRKKMSDSALSRWANKYRYQ